MDKCTHEHTIAGTAGCYTHSVAAPPYTNENRAAAGGITYTETCLDCGAERPVNENGVHVEVGTWGADRAARQERERAARHAHEQAQAESDAVVARLLGVSVRHVESPTLYDDPVVVIERRGELDTPMLLSTLVTAATQVDTGDALVPTYRHLLRVTRQHMERAACDA
ncbi:MAG: hypothetical protein L0271_06690 [Gemmatimonadetes bacterium]|nr:hypothetical protein [Gemmatimonadota bacterium]